MLPFSEHRVISESGWQCDICGVDVNGQTDDLGRPIIPGDSVRHTPPNPAQIARALWDWDMYDMPADWRDMAWNDMDDGYSEERIKYELLAEEIWSLTNAD